MFLYGVAGGGIAYLALFVVPGLKQVVEDGDFPGRNQLVGLGLLALVYLIMGGGAAVIIGDATEAKHAIAYGAGWEAVFKGGSEGAVAIRQASKKS